jgi:hypothetical protein
MGVLELGIAVRDGRQTAVERMGMWDIEAQQVEVDHIEVRHLETRHMESLHGAVCSAHGLLEVGRRCDWHE